MRPLKQPSNDNRPFIWLGCTSCKEPGFFAKLDGKVLSFHCATCNTDVTNALLSLIWDA